LQKEKDFTDIVKPFYLYKTRGSLFYINTFKGGVNTCRFNGNNTKNIKTQMYRHVPGLQIFNTAKSRGVNTRRSSKRTSLIIKSNCTGTEPGAQILHAHKQLSVLV
jgi:hypothetical protein